MQRDDQELEAPLDDFNDEKDTLLRKRKVDDHVGYKQPKHDKDDESSSKVSNICKLPWFGSWSKTILIWIVSFNSLVFWSLPSPTFRGKLGVFAEVWSVDRIAEENKRLQAQLQDDSQHIVQVEQAQDTLKIDRQGDASEISRLRAELVGVKAQLESSRKENENLQVAERKAQDELQRMRSDVSDTSRSVTELQSTRTRLEQDAAREKSRADRLAAKLKKLREAELPLLSDIADETKM